MSWSIEGNVCPGLFYGTPAADGFLVRLRTPGGILNAQQIQAIAVLLSQSDREVIQVTNRANLQLRAVQSAPTAELLKSLQAVGLAARQPQMDRLRNVMASPTAGIDRGEILDVSPWVRELDAYLQDCTELAGLPAKFSIGLDGGGRVGIGTRSPISWEHRYNEIQLSAVEQDELPCFHLALGGDRVLYDTSISIELGDCISVVAALAQVYLDYVQAHPQTSKPPRMKHLLRDWGVAAYLDRVNHQLAPFSIRLRPHGELLKPLPSDSYGHLGIHRQRQPDLYYVGLGLPLGQLTIEQWLGLGTIATNCGQGQIRLTPWQTILLPDLPQSRLDDVLQSLADLGLILPKHLVATAIVACAGKPGCLKALTHTQNHALALADYLTHHQPLDRPVNIHLTGCPKSCAQSSPAEITLLGTTLDRHGEPIEGYHIYLDNNLALTDIPVADLPTTIGNLLRVDSD